MRTDKYQWCKRNFPTHTGEEYYLSINVAKVDEILFWLVPKTSKIICYTSQQQAGEVLINKYKILPLILKQFKIYQSYYYNYNNKYNVSISTYAVPPPYTL